MSPNSSDIARVVQEQDSAVPAAKTMVQLQSPRSTIKNLRVHPVKPSTVKSMIVEQHYLHSMPAAPRMCFGVFDGENLEGAVVFSSGARNGHLLMSAVRPQEVATLARLWLSDALLKNAESRVIGAVLRHLRQHTNWKLVLSYADPEAGHVGTIYQATGWLYFGQQQPSSYVHLGDGVLLHPRTIYKRYGSNAIGHLRRTGIPAERQAVGAKYRYAYVLNPAWRWRLAIGTRPYPRKNTMAEV